MTVDLDAEFAINRYSREAARFRLMAFTFLEEGKDAEAEGALAYARLCERAAEAEEEPPEPGDPGIGCTCFMCRWYRLNRGLS